MLFLSLKMKWFGECSASATHVQQQGMRYVFVPPSFYLNALKDRRPSMLIRFLCLFFAIVNATKI